MKNRATIGWRTPLSKDQNWKQKKSPTLWRKCFRMLVWASKSVEWLRRSLILSVSLFSGIQSKKSCYICVPNTTFQRPKLKIKKFPNALANFLSNAGLIIKIDRVVAEIFDSFPRCFLCDSAPKYRISVQPLSPIFARSALLFVDALIWISVRPSFVRRFSDLCEGDMRGGHMPWGTGVLTWWFFRVPKKEGR